HPARAPAPHRVRHLPRPGTRDPARPRARDLRRCLSRRDRRPALARAFDRADAAAAAGRPHRLGARRAARPSAGAGLRPASPEGAWLMVDTLLRSLRFRTEREATWKQLEKLLKRVEGFGPGALSDEDMVALPALYRATLSSLSVARET